MTPGFGARRGAEEFSSLVEGTSTQERGSSRYGDLLEIVTSLRETAPVEPRAEFTAALRRDLMAEAGTVLTPAAARLTVTPRRNPRERRVAVAIGAFAVVSATTSMAMAAQTALPGETLYPLKRALENASTTIQIDEDAKGASMLEHASGRLDEVDELTRQSDEPNSEAVADTLHAFTDQASSASDLLIASYTDQGDRDDIEELRTFTAQSMAVLNELETVVPDTARAALIEAAQVVNLIDTAAIRLCPTCGDGTAQTPEFEAAASVDEILGDLGSALVAPLTGSEPDKSPGKGDGGRSPAAGDDGSEARGDGGKDDELIDLPSPIPDEIIADGEPGNGDDVPEADVESDVIDNLADKLSGRDKGPKSNQGTIGDLLDQALDNLVTGLLR